MKKFGRNVLKSFKRKARKLPPEAELGIGILFIISPDSFTDVIGIGLSADGIRRLYKKRKRRK